MRHLKKYASLLLALVMALALAAPAFADETPNGTITVEGAIEKETYTLYKIFDLDYSETSTNSDTTIKSYSYTIWSNGPWYKFVTGDTGSQYIELARVPGQADDADPVKFYVSWKNGSDGEAMDAAEFAKAALAYAKANTNTISAVDSKKAEKDTPCTFTNLDYGYYLLDSSVGALCALDSATPSVTLKEKNVEPTNKKEVEEDSTGDYGEKNDAQIGQTVNFQSTITAQAGAVNYVFHDEMSAGLTYTKGSVKVTLNGTDVDDDDTNYTVNENPTGNHCTFEVAFTESFCNDLKANDTIVISYSAVLNDKAVIGGTGNPNKSKLSYGDEGKSETEFSQTTTYVWEFDVEKYTVENNVNIQLAGAKFTLSTEENGTPITFVKDTTKDTDVYRVATDDEKTNNAITKYTEITTGDSGHFKLEGLDEGTYYLTETEAPEGYNKLTDSIVIKIDGVADEKPADPDDPDAETKAVVAGSVSQKVKDPTTGSDVFEGVDTKIIMVLNNTGAVLPSTGGIGTTIFYVVGGVLVVGAAILLVTKKRMSSR